MSKPMIQLIYASVATERCGMPQLVEILELSRKANQRLGMTGILLHSNGSFLQVLEGEPAVVDELYRKLLLDNRHAQMTLIIREPIQKRYFGSWTMGFSDVSPEELQSIAGMNDFFQNGTCFTLIDVGRAKKLLAAFAKGRWRAKMSGPKLRAA